MDASVDPVAALPDPSPFTDIGRITYSAASQCERPQIFQAAAAIYVSSITRLDVAITETP
jgi:hypothetical protein